MSPLPLPPPGAGAPHHAHQNNIYARRRNSASRGSTSSLSGDDDDAITPCPLEAHHSNNDHHHQQQQSQLQQQQQQQGNPQRPASPSLAPPNNLQSQQQAMMHRRNSWRNSQTIMPMHPDPAMDNGDAAAAGRIESDIDVDAETLWHRMLAIQKMFGCYNSARMRAALDTGAESGFIPSRTCLDLLNDSIDQLPEEAKRKLEDFLGHGDERPILGRSWRHRLLRPVFATR
ncbi:hypothetical protein B0T22DRAFT_480338 [Podospora appendiculata]|uniref:Uncharacterized protein n=1 Tax=Podospora appendiculata TaxID=314037 RepID=A0AAE1CD07_9PEZI|nr:hypothetical protein B0T22DRAFT_480338 [Podospora appendiculata]